MSRLRRRIAAGGPERGFTLAELLVYCALLAIVLPLAGSLLLGAVIAQRDVQAVNTATASVQAVAASVESGVRNASAIRATAFGDPEDVDPSQLLVVRTRGTDASPRWFCQAWYYDAFAGTVRTRRVAAEKVGSPIVRPAAATTPGWTELASGVTAAKWRGPGPAPAPVPVFEVTPTATPTTVRIGLEIGAGERPPVVLIGARERPPVALSTSITKRPQGETASTPCF
ncbi:prepilin-type N-terminal cleavage/methylation domain-containing protein [Cellulomonas sp. ATA003]|uniref:PulJ/GspJ family protein n=1 Tax=Cellulomonas sp. ATA003 TaxID=3073064 RepID=UPI0028738A23|nr:prepilin-type N-terminal cleavage/methylation domain-containing protein [Cellulomonas sp. ATA003]WNB87380.1 prepilin-type N-terminal cleavage/methylation domain-containing protein [Cellulomonas sp. ATA003]